MNSTDVTLNILATYPATVAASFAFLTAVLYGVGSPWYRSLLGIIFFGLFVGSVPVFALITARRIAAAVNETSPQFTGDGFGPYAFAVYSIAAIIWIGVFLGLVIERRNKPMVEIPVDRH